MRTIVGELYEERCSDFTFKAAVLAEHFSQAMGERLEYTIQLP